MTEFVFPSGIVVFFRMMAAENQLARSVHPTARNILLKDDNLPEGDYVLLDAHDQFLALFPRDFVAAILPLETEGPAGADNRSKPLTN